MSLSKIAVKRPVTTTMVLLIAVAFGILSIFNLKLDMMPNMNIPIAIVSTTYSGVGPEEMVNLVTKPLESALGTVAGVKEISSQSSNGSSVVILQFEDGTNIDNAALDMRERVDMVKGMLPDDASDPRVMKIDFNSMSSFMIGISSDKYDLVDLKRVVEDSIVGRLERQDGVASVSVSGGHEKEIAVTLQEDKLRGYGIAETQITQLLGAENRTVPSGTIKQGDATLQVRVTGEFESLDDIRDIILPTSTGGSVFLRDIATVEEVYKDTASLSYIEGQPSISLSIQKQSTANTVNVSDAVLKELALIEKEMPDVTVKTLLDPAEYIKETLNSVIDSAWQGGLLAVVILFIFLRNVRSALVVAVSMPTSIVVTFVLMYYSNITLNMMSLGGLALGIGMLVDNSIVVLESIYRKIEEGDDRITAAIEGAREVAMAVTSSTLTTVAIFLPITFSGGMAAQIFNELALTIAFSLFSSLAVSLTFVPMMCSLILKVETVRGVHSSTNIFTKLLDLVSAGIVALRNGYEKVLRGALKRKALTVIIAFVFVVLTFMTLPIIGMEFMPSTDQNGVGVSISMPKGTLLEETEKAADTAIEKIRDYPGITDLSWSIGGGNMMGFGGSSTDSASITVTLIDKNERDKSSNEIAAEMTRLLSDIPGAEITVNATSQGMGSYGGGASVDLNIKGESLDELTTIARDMQDLFAGIEGVTNVTTSVEDATPQATIKVNRAKANSYGISAYSVSSIISTAVSGTVATTYKVNGDEYDVRVRQDKESYDYITDIENILIPSPMGINVPLYEIAEIQKDTMPVSIARDNRQTYISVSASFIGRDMNSVSTDISNVMSSYIMPANYSWEYSGSMDMMNETFGSLGFALLMGVLLVYMIMAALFESLIYPFIVMFSIPIALTGGIFGLFVFGESLSVTAFLGLIMLVGIVINNGIVLIDYVNLLINERGMEVYDAVMLAGPVRLQPILMTTLTTTLALVPMMFTTQQGSEMMKGLAITVVFGLTLSTLITLILVPVVYVIFTNMKTRLSNFRKRFSKKQQTPEIA